MQDTSFKFPTETVPLPSKGLLYNSDNILAKGEVEMRYGGAREEDILTNQNFIKQGVVLDKLLQSMLVDKINLDDLLIGDKNALLISARILLYGKEYKFKIKNPYESDNQIQISIDLTTVKENLINESLITRYKNEFSYKLPNSQVSLTFKLLTVGDEKNIELEHKNFKKITNQSTEISTRLKYMITSVNGNRDQKTIRDFVDNSLLAKDSMALREYVKQIQPNVNLSFEYDFGKGIEEVPIPITVDFFWPTT